MRHTTPQKTEQESAAAVRLAEAGDALTASQHKNRTLAKAYGAPMSGRAAIQSTVSGMNRMHGQTELQLRTQAYIAGQFVEQSKHNKDDDHVERQVHCMEGPSIKIRKLQQLSGTSPFAAAIVIALFSYTPYACRPKGLPNQLRHGAPGRKLES